MEKKDKKEKPQSEIEKRKKQAEEYLDGWKRAKADLINYKKRQEEISGEFVKFANEDLILELLPILDNFTLAAKHLPKNLENSDWIKGIFQIKSQIENLLTARGIEEIKSKGEKFNPEFHEAIEEIKSSGKEQGIIIEELQKGYKLNGKVIRAARVKIAK
jgi:molecular chaperone GrpE